MGKYSTEIRFRINYLDGTGGKFMPMKFDARPQAVEIREPGRMDSMTDNLSGYVYMHVEGHLIVVGAEGTYVEFGGRRYSTFEDYQELRREIDGMNVGDMIESLNK